MADMVKRRLIFTDGATFKSADLDDESIWTSLSGMTETDATVAAYYRAVPWLWRGVNLIAQSISALPFALVSKSGEDYDTSDEWENKVGFLPNPSNLLWLVSAALTLTATAYLYKRPTRGGGIYSLAYLLPSSVTPDWSKADGSLIGFKRRVGAQDIPLKIEDVIYFWTPDPWVEQGPGTPPAQAAMMAAGVLYNKDKFTSKYFERGAIKAMLLKVGAGTQKDERDRLKAWWKRLFSGVNKSWTTEVINADVLEPVTIGEGIGDLENVDLTTTARDDIAAALGIPRTMLFSDAATNATAGEDRLSFYNETVVPNAGIIAEGLNEQLFGALGLRMEFRPETLDVYQEDENDRAQALQALTTAGVELPLAMQVLGYELPPGYTYEDMQAQEEERRVRADELAERLRQARETAQPGQPTEQQGPPQEGERPGQAIRADLDKWQRLALRRHKEGKSLDYPFESEAIPGDLKVSIQAALLLAQDEQEVRAAFQPLPFRHGWEGYP